MPPPPGRPRKGDRRIDAAIDHFAVMGYAPRDVRTVVNRLLKLYGSADAWPLLEEGSYQLVLDLLIEKQEEEEKQQLLLEHHPQSEELLEHHPQTVELLDHQRVAQEPLQHQGPAEDETPQENNMALLEVHNEVSAEPESPDEGMEEDHAFAEPLALQALVPHPIAMQTHGPDRPCPCYGWISESDDDEEEITDQQPEVHVLSVGGSHYKRKRPET